MSSFFFGAFRNLKNTHSRQDVSCKGKFADKPPRVRWNRELSGCGKIGKCYGNVEVRPFLLLVRGRERYGYFMVLRFRIPEMGVLERGNDPVLALIDRLIRQAYDGKRIESGGNVNFYGDWFGMQSDDVRTAKCGDAHYLIIALRIKVFDFL